MYDAVSCFFVSDFQQQKKGKELKHVAAGHSPTFYLRKGEMKCETRVFLPPFLHFRFRLFPPGEL